MRLSEEILFLITWGETYFPELKGLLDRPEGLARLLPRSQRAVRRTLQRLVRAGLVRRIGGRQGRYELRASGKARAVTLWPYVTNKPWDGQFRAVVFDIPERFRGMRGVLRRFLRSLGFQPFQRSLWVTPFAVDREVRAFLTASRLERMAFLWHVEVGVDQKAFAARSWNLEKLDREYRKLADRCDASERPDNALKAECSRILFADPLLPRALEPVVFSRSTALTAYTKLLERGH